jgi:hypothetical protein
MAGTCIAMKARPISWWQELRPAVSSLNAFANFALSFASIASPIDWTGFAMVVTQ